MNNLFQRHEIRFIAWFSGIFLLTIAILSGTGFIPSEFQEKTPEPGIFEKMRLAFLGVPYWAPSATELPSRGTSKSTTTTTNKNTTTEVQVETPVRLAIPMIDLDTGIRNPASTNTTLLDDELQRGAVRYPGSGYPGVGNMFIFGHSTSFSIVQNQAYKVFNRLKELKTGDEIKVYSDSQVYVYKVTTVKKVDKNDTWVKFDVDNNILTLSTCDSFGKKADRYVVEAQYISKGAVK
ncbi:MAG: hypothetical protein RL094_306 [Candidatus Parcubacteria bacterium]|jgi:LPXTG-site transpeptidase (sortase) family protein